MEEISSADKMIAYISIEVGRRYNSNKERARDLDISEANASRFVRFMSGLGMDVAIKIAEAKFGGSIDAFRKAADEWWERCGLGAVISEMPSGRFEHEIRSRYPHAGAIKYACDLARQQGIQNETIIRVATLCAKEPQPESQEGYVEKVLDRMGKADVGTVRNVRRSVYPGQSKKPVRK